VTGLTQVYSKKLATGGCQIAFKKGVHFSLFSTVELV